MVFSGEQILRGLKKIQFLMSQWKLHVLTSELNFCSEIVGKKTCKLNWSSPASFYTQPLLFVPTKSSALEWIHREDLHVITCES